MLNIAGNPGSPANKCNEIHNCTNIKISEEFEKESNPESWVPLSL